MRLRFEEVKTRPVFSETAEHLLQDAKEDCPTFIMSQENAMQRLHALCVGLEYVGIMSFSRGVQGSDGRWTGGSLTYHQQMEESRHSTSGVQFVVLADKLIRGTVHKVVSEHTSRYHTFSDAFNTVLVEHKDLWQEARMEALRGQKRGVELSSSGVSNSAVPDMSSAPKTDTNSNQKK